MITSATRVADGDCSTRTLARSRVILDRDTPVNAVFLRRIIGRRLVIRAAVVPDHDIALAPLVAILRRRLLHQRGQLRDDRLALVRCEPFELEDLVLIEVQELAPRLRVNLDETV